MKKIKPATKKELRFFIGFLDGLITEQREEIKNLSLEIKRLKAELYFLKGKASIINLKDFKETNILN